MIPIELVKVSALHSFILAFSLANSLAASRIKSITPISEDTYAMTRRFIFSTAFLQVCWQAREDEDWSPTRTTRIKERLKARLFAFLKRKADYAIRGSTISPTLMAGGEC